MKKIGFFFGAGAELAYGLPSGADYTRQTILAKRTRLYAALKEFYQGRLGPLYIEKYESQFLFQKNSSAFRQIVWEAAEMLQNKREQDVDAASQQVINKWHPKEEEDNQKKNAFSAEVEKVYQAIVLDYDEDHQEKNRGPHNNSDGKSYQALRKYFSYFGSVERDFATIIDPKKSPIRFWRLINYFWGAFFAILLPILDASATYGHNQEYQSNKYRYVLQNLKDVLKDIYSTDILTGYNYSVGNDEPRLEYYRLIRETLEKKQKIDVAFTTNYTPFVYGLWNEGLMDPKQVAFLAGELQLFEFPHELLIRSLLAAQSKDDDFMFPYLLTQAPVKPIIEPGQIREYAKAIGFLKEIDMLVVLGYGINDEDHHIRALLREYVTSPAKKLVYLKYYPDQAIKKSEDDIRKEICRILHVDEECQSVYAEIQEKDEHAFCEQINRICLARE